MPIPATIRVRLLGSFEVSSDGRAVPLPGARVRVVLAVLALSAGEGGADRDVDRAGLG